MNNDKHFYTGDSLTEEINHLEQEVKRLKSTLVDVQNTLARYQRFNDPWIKRQKYKILKYLSTWCRNVSKIN